MFKNSMFLLALLLALSSFSCSQDMQEVGTNDDSVNPAEVAIDEATQTESEGAEQPSEMHADEEQQPSEVPEAVAQPTAVADVPTEPEEQQKAEEHADDTPVPEAVDASTGNEVPVEETPQKEMPVPSESEPVHGADDDKTAPAAEEHTAETVTEQHEENQAEEKAQAQSDVESGHVEGTENEVKSEVEKQEEEQQKEEVEAKKEDEAKEEQKVELEKKSVEAPTVSSAENNSTTIATNSTIVAEGKKGAKEPISFWAKLVRLFLPFSWSGSAGNSQQNATNSTDESGATRGIRTQGIVAMEFGSSSSEESNDELGTLEKEHPLSGEKEVKDDDKPTEESNAVTKASLKVGATMMQSEVDDNGKTHSNVTNINAEYIG